MIGESYLASLFALDRDSFPPGQATDGAIYAIALLIGGPLFRLLMVLGKVIVSGIGFGVVGQVGTARVLYGMARDGKLPRFLAHVNRRSRVPDAAIVLVAAINLIFALALANQLLLLISMVSFGALFGFLMLHISVIVHFVVRQNSRDWLRHLVVPLIGIAIVGYMLVNMAVEAKILGLAWLAIGALTATALKLTGRRIAMPI
jgi:amino acid transporter